jgi:hypothetical protein
MNKILHLIIISSAILFLSACSGFNDPFYNSGGYNSGPSYNSGYDWDYEQRRRNERDRYEIERERRRVEEERRRLNEERENVWSAPAQAAPVRRETCPSGFSPSENKCSVEERRRGCKDMRLPGGLGCVRR